MAFTENPAWVNSKARVQHYRFQSYSIERCPKSGLLNNKSEILFFVFCILSHKRTNVRYLLLDEIYMYSNHIGKVSTANLSATRMEVGRIMLLIQPLETLSLPNFSSKTQMQNGNTRRNGAEFLNSSHEPS